MRNLQEQVKKVFCYQKLFWPFTVWINCSSDLNNFANSRPSAWNFKCFNRSLEHFFLTVGQNNFGNKIPFPKMGFIFVDYLIRKSTQVQSNNFLTSLYFFWVKAKSSSFEFQVTQYTFKPNYVWYVQLICSKMDFYMRSYFNTKTLQGADKNRTQF